MDHTDHVALLHDAAPTFEGVWADLGAGGGAFTLALADLMSQSAEIYAVDTDQSALADNERAMRDRFPHMIVHYRKADFARPLDLPPLDGVVMANSLHFHKRKQPIIEAVRAMLKPEGRLILVEYNADHGNMWVPHPLSYPTWEQLAAACGFESTRLVATYPSRFLREIYSAVSWVGLKQG